MTLDSEAGTKVKKSEDVVEQGEMPTNKRCSLNIFSVRTEHSYLLVSRHTMYIVGVTINYKRVEIHC